MRTRIRALRLALLLLTLLAGRAKSQPSQTGAIVVEPGDLPRRTDLVGRLVSVDDRVGRFQFHPGKGNDEVFLKRCPDITFAIPERLREAHPSSPTVRVEGTLRREGGQLVVDVSAIDYLPADLARLNANVATLARSDVEKRNAWVRWAERRATDFHDEALLARAREVAGEAIRAEAEHAPRDRDSGARFLELAERARKGGVAEPEPSALAHRGFRVELAAAKSAQSLTTLGQRIEAFFPNVRAPSNADTEVELGRWEHPYANDPADAYRRASSIARSALDHRLWADVQQRRIERLAADDPSACLLLSEEAANLLPDRPAVASSLLEKGLASEASHIGNLRKAEVERLGRLYREKLNQPDKARDLFRAWLDDQRLHRLSVLDAEGRLALAEQYEQLLGDRAMSVALLREAWKIDPRSTETADAFRRRGFQRIGDSWVETGQGAPSTTAKPDPIRELPRNDQPVLVGSTVSPLGKTPEEIRRDFGGKPNRKSYCATQGQVVEQWVYVQAKTNTFVTFVRKAGDQHPRVTSYFSLPRKADENP